jgi:hypothetical protein
MKRQFQKQVEVVEKDDDEQVAISAVLVPNEVDHQLDFLRPEGVENLFNPDADIGVMHAVFPDDAAESGHRLLDEPETIGGREFEAGTWIERREYEDEELWQLVDDGILEGRSIGGKVTDEREYAPDEVPDDVAFGEGVPTDQGAYQILDGEVNEVSDVDIPAVPEATHAVVKNELGKNVLEETDGKDEFIERMVERGHSEEDAERLWSYLQDAEGDKNAMTDNDTVDDEQRDKELDDEDVGFVKWLRSRFARKGASRESAESEKEGRTLSDKNIRHAKATHDHAERMLSSEGVDAHSASVRTYNDDEKDDFSLGAEEKARSLGKLTAEQAEYVVEAVEEFVEAQGAATFGEFEEWVWYASEDWREDKSFAVHRALDEYLAWRREQRDSNPVSGEFAAWLRDGAGEGAEIELPEEVEASDDSGGNPEGDPDKSMTEDNDNEDEKSGDPMQDAPEWAKKLHENQQEQKERIDELEGDGDEKSDDPMEDAPDWAKELREQQQEQKSRIDRIAGKEAESDQPAEKGGGDEDESGLDRLSKALN